MVWELNAFLTVLDSAEESAQDCEISYDDWRRFGPMLQDWLYRQN